MKRLLTVVALVALAAPARAHFVWILPPEKDGQPIRVVFSDGLQPDKPELLKKVGPDPSQRQPPHCCGYLMLFLRFQIIP